MSKSLVELGWVAKGLPSALRGIERAPGSFPLPGMRGAYASNRIQAHESGRALAATRPNVGRLKGKPFMAGGTGKQDFLLGNGSGNANARRYAERRLQGSSPSRPLRDI